MTECIEIQKAYLPIIGTSSKGNIGFFGGDKAHFYEDEDNWPTCNSCANPMTIIMQVKDPLDDYDQTVQVFLCVNNDCVGDHEDEDDIGDFINPPCCFVRHLNLELFDTVVKCAPENCIVYPQHYISSWEFVDDIPPPEIMFQYAVLNEKFQNLMLEAFPEIEFPLSDDNYNLVYDQFYEGYKHHPIAGVKFGGYINSNDIKDINSFIQLQKCEYMPYNWCDGGVLRISQDGEIDGDYL